MNSLIKQYIKNTKAFFPVIGKQEKKYLKRLELHIQDYCEDNSVSSLDDLYQNFGTPAEVLNTYYLTVDTEYILKQVKKSHIIKTGFIVLILSCLIATTTYCSVLYQGYKIFKEEQLFSEDYFID